MLYQCPIHDQDYEKNEASCADCTRIMSRIRENNEAIKRRGKKTPRLRMSVYWPSRMSHEGRVIEHLTHEPIYVKNKDEYRHALKATNSLEAG